MNFGRALILNFPKISIEAPPMAPALLAQICNNNNVDYNFIDCNLDFYTQLNGSIKSEILELFAEGFQTTLSDSAQAWIDSYFDKLVNQCNKHDLIAISVFSNHSHALVNEFLQKNKSKITAKIVIGGAGIAAEQSFGVPFYQHLKTNNLIDFWVLGEGDVGFKDLLLGNDSAGTFNNEMFNNLRSFSDIPTPNFDKFMLDEYSKLYVKKIVAVEGSRGCVKKCTFCDIQNTWGAYKYKDGITLAQELLDLKEKYNINHFWFTDSLINGSMKSFRDFIKHIAANNHGSFTWSSQAIVRPQSSHDDEDFKLLKESGCETLAVGIESFSEPVRFHMGKKFTDDDLDKFLHLAQKYNISIYLLMIIGYPTETQQDFEHALKQLERYQHLADDGTISGIRIGGTMSIIPNTPIHKMQKSLGIKSIDRDDKFKTMMWSLNDNTAKQRIKWRVELEDRARQLGYNCADKEMHIELAMLDFLKQQK